MTLLDTVTPVIVYSLATCTVLVEVFWSRQFRAVHALAWNILQTQRRRKAAISQQPLFAPRERSLTG